MKDNEQKDRVRRSLVGGAIGDALGFLLNSSIHMRKYKSDTEKMVS